MDDIISNEATKPVTLKDIAEECGVNVGTVSRALRNDGRLCKSTVERIKLVATNLGYDASRNHAARRLALSRFGQPVLNNMVGLFFHHGGFCHSNYFFKVLQGVLDAIARQDFELCTSDQAGIGNREALPMNYRRGDVDGVLMISQAYTSQKAIELLRSEVAYSSKPIVGLVEHMPGCSGVYADNYDAGRQVIDHLLGLGHRFFVHFHDDSCLGGETDVHGLRLSAIRDGLKARGMEPEKHILGGRWNFDDGPASASALLELLKEHSEVTAVVAHDDEQAQIIYSALGEAGYRVPTDVSLVSYDDTDAIPGPDGRNTLTTVHLPLTEIGMEGTRFLIKRILGQEPEDRDVVLPVELMVRGTTGPASR